MMAQINPFYCLISLFFLVSLHKSAIATSSTDHQAFSNQQSHILSFGEEAEGQFLEIINLVNQMEDSPQKVNRLIDLAKSAIQQGKFRLAKQFLNQAFLITKGFNDPIIQVDLLTNIAPNHTQIGQPEEAKNLLTLAVEITNSLEDLQRQSELLLEIAFTYQSIGLEEDSKLLTSRSQDLMTKTALTVASFPFKQTPRELRFGLTGNVNSFRDTTASLGINTAYYKQWPSNDIYFNGTASISFDSSRSVNNYRPSGTLSTIYRHHFNKKWHFFADNFTITNQDLFSSRNDTEDLTIITTGLIGAGLNLWRGQSAKEFLDIQLGLGTRYEYDFIAFEERRNQIEPVLSINLIGRGFKLGKATINNGFLLTPSLSEPENTIIVSDTRLSVPLSQRWRFTNRLFIRYRTQTIFEANPKVQFFFTTGIDYQF